MISEMDTEPAASILVAATKCDHIPQTIVPPICCTTIAAVTNQLDVV